MIKRAILILGDDQMNGPRAVWASLPAGYGYNFPKAGDVFNSVTGEIVAHIAYVSISTFWVVAYDSNSVGVQTFVAAYEAKNKVRFEDVPTRVLYLDLNMVPDNNHQKLKRSVPSDYIVTPVHVFAGEPETFLVSIVWNEKEQPVATVRVVDGRFVFEYEVNAFSANHFESWLRGSLRVTTT